MAAEQLRCRQGSVLSCPPLERSEGWNNQMCGLDKKYNSGEGELPAINSHPLTPNPMERISSNALLVFTIPGFNL